MVVRDVNMNVQSSARFLCEMIKAVASLKTHMTIYLFNILVVHIYPNKCVVKNNMQRCYLLHFSLYHFSCKCAAKDEIAVYLILSMCVFGGGGYLRFLGCCLAKKYMILHSCLLFP